MTEAVRTDQLTKRYGLTTALDSLDLVIEVGEVLGFLGPNGAGKSTTIALLLGLIRPTAGRVTIFGLDAWRDAPEIHRRVGYVPSEGNLWPSLTGAEVMQYLASVHGWVDVEYRAELVERFELDVDKKIRAYSHGSRQKVLLVAALASRAELLLLDEPTTGLDPLMERVFRACVGEARDNGQGTLAMANRLPRGHLLVGPVRNDGWVDVENFGERHRRVGRQHVFYASPTSRSSRHATTCAADSKRCPTRSCRTSPTVVSGSAIGTRP